MPRGINTGDERKEGQVNERKECKSKNDIGNKSNKDCKDFGDLKNMLECKDLYRNKTMKGRYKDKLGCKP